MNEGKQLINLASNEYFKAVKQPLIQGEIISPEFKDYKNGKYKIISFYAKKARGLMTRWLMNYSILMWRVIAIQTSIRRKINLFSYAQNKRKLLIILKLLS